MGLLSPKFRILRGGQAVTVKPGSRDELLALRTELELLRRFALGVSDRVLNALRSRLESPEPATSGISPDDLRDLITTLDDGRSDVTAQAIASFDRKHPELSAELDMDIIGSESDQFAEDVLAAIESSGAADADDIAREYESVRTQVSGGAGSADVNAGEDGEDDEVITDWAEASAEDATAPAPADDAEFEQLAAQALADADAIEATAATSAEATETAPADDTADADALADAILADAAGADVPESVVDEDEELLRDLDLAEVLAAEEATTPGEPAEATDIEDTAADAQAKMSDADNTDAAEDEQLSEELAAVLADAESQVAEVSEAMSAATDSLTELSVEIAEATAGATTAPAREPAPARSAPSTAAGHESHSGDNGTSGLSGLEAELGAIEKTFGSAFEQLSGILERVRDTWNAARDGAAQAERFRSLIARVDDAQTSLEAAKEESRRAEAEFQASRERLDAARSAWEQAQQEAVAAAAKMG